MFMLAKCLIIAGVIFYIVAGLFIYFKQYDLLYIPNTYSFEQAETRAKENSFAIWPTQDPNYLGLLSDTRIDAPQGTVLFFHGNAESAMERTYYSDTLNALGYRVILVEYPGYGAKAGSLGEPSMVNQGCQTVQQAYKQFNSPIYIVAESLGCGIACAVARDTQSMLNGLLLITPWDTLPNLAQQRYPIFPTRYLSKDKYDTINNLQSMNCPIGIVIAALDVIIPPERAENLVSHLPATIQVWRMDQVGHNNWLDKVDMTWWQQAMTYLSSQNTPLPEAP